MKRAKCIVKYFKDTREFLLFVVPMVSLGYIVFVKSCWDAGILIIKFIN